RDALEKWLFGLLFLNALVQNGLCAVLRRSEKCSPRAVRDLGSHQDPDLVQLLPLAIELQEASDLEEASRDVEALRNVCPVVEVAGTRPPRDAVVDDEKLATPSRRVSHCGRFAHDAPSEWQISPSASLRVRPGPSVQQPGSGWLVRSLS